MCRRLAGRARVLETLGELGWAGAQGTVRDTSGERAAAGHEGLCTRWDG